MANNDAFSKLPQDIIFQILKKIPTKSLLQLRSVSKQFTTLTSHPHFLNLHLSSPTPPHPHPHHLLYYESTDYTKIHFSFHDPNTFSLCKSLEAPFKSFNGYLRLVGSSRGLVCLFDTNYFNFVGTVILWNPFIGKFKILPNLVGFSYFRNNFSHMSVGFGFDHKGVDFKVVKILYCHRENDCIMPRAFVYSLKIGSWKSIDLLAPCSMPKTWSSSVFVNGVVHWLAYKRPELNGQPNCIMGFDVIEEGFKMIELPRNIGANCRELRLSPLVDENSLALFISYRENVGEKLDVFYLNGYGKVESWTRKYTIDLERVFFPLKIVNCGEILVAISDEKLVLIDIKEEEMKGLDICGLPLSFYMAGYVPSLALLDFGQQLLK